MFSEIFRPVCAGCGEDSPDSIFCADCRDSLRHLKMFCRTCGHPLNVDALTCGFCPSRRYDRLFTDYLYSFPLKEMLKKIKFTYGVRGIFHLGELIRQPGDVFSVYDIVTPVPSHFTRKLRRIIHPADVLAEHIASLSGKRAERLIIRRKKTGYQWKLKKKQRIRNVSGAFALSGECSGKKILIVDDIYTTGSTVNECARVLKINGAELVDVYALSCSGYY